MGIVFSTITSTLKASHCCSWAIRAWLDANKKYGDQDHWCLLTSTGLFILSLALNVLKYWLLLRLEKHNLMRVCSEQDIITTAIKLMLSSCTADVLLNSSYIISECFLKYLRHLRSSVQISLETVIFHFSAFSQSTCWAMIWVRLGKFTWH